jgi:hypothetical protein
MPGAWGLCALCALSAALAPRPARAQPAAEPCTEWRECRQRTEDAIAAGQFETAHDLAWRTVQTGHKDDPDLLFLLARAQSLSGRPGDALVMLRRLAERGVHLDVAGQPDFERARRLDGWPEVETLIARVNAGERAPALSWARTTTAEAGAPPASVAPRPAAPAAAPVGAPAPPAGPARAERPAGVDLEPVRFVADRFVASALAYDAVSRRYLFGDRDGRKLRVLGEGLDRTVDLVTAASAGFFSVTAMEIDVTRGDLWVATGDASGDGAVHKLQLLSGRLLKMVPAAARLAPVALVDLAVSPAGAVIALDGAGGRLLRLRPGGSVLEVAATLNVPQPASLAMGRAEGVVYVSHLDGLFRVDLDTRTSAPMALPADADAGRIERLRRHEDGLVGVQQQPDGSRRVVRIALNGSGRGVTRVTRLEPAAPLPAGRLAASVSGDELSLVQVDAFHADDTPDAAPTHAPAEFVVHRVRLRAP